MIEVVASGRTLTRNLGGDRRHAANVRPNHHYQSLDPRRGYSIIPAVNPILGAQWDIRTSHARIDAVAKRSAGQAKELAYIVPSVLLYPTAIFQGVREDGERDWLCYCGLPENAYEGNSGARIAPWLGNVYLVYVNADRVAYNSRWEKCDPENIKQPRNCLDDNQGNRGRFERRLL